MLFVPNPLDSLWGSGSFWDCCPGAASGALAGTEKDFLCALKVREDDPPLQSMSLKYEPSSEPLHIRTSMSLTHERVGQELAKRDQAMQDKLTKLL